MHPALIKAFDAKRAAKIAKEKAEAAVAEVETAIELGEIQLVDGKFTEGRFQMQRLERTTYKYSPAVDAMREQEIMEGVATSRKTASLRFVEKDE